MTEQNGKAEEVFAAKAFEVEQRVKNNIRLTRRLWTEMAADLFAVVEDKLWRDLGYDSLEEWCAQPEIDLTSRWVYQMRQLWRGLVIEAKVKVEMIADTEPSKLLDVLPAIRRGQVTVQQAIDDCNAMPRRDLQVRYGNREVARNPADDNDLERPAAYAYRCTTCGSIVPFARPRN